MSTPTPTPAPLTLQTVQKDVIGAIRATERAGTKLRTSLYAFVPLCQTVFTVTRASSIRARPDGRETYSGANTIKDVFRHPS